MLRISVHKAENEYTYMEKKGKNKTNKQTKTKQKTKQKIKKIARAHVRVSEAVVAVWW